MFHYIQTITNLQGDAQDNSGVAIIDRDTGDRVDIYQDEVMGTPWPDNLADADEYGLVSLYVADGVYHVDIYTGSTLFRRIENIVMVGEVSQEQLDALADTEAARDLAIGAKDDAEAAQLAAETAQGLAEGAQTAAETAQGLAEDAQAAAELAADAAAVSAGLYADEATGNAAVSDGDIFAAVGATNDEAVDIWERVSSGNSTLLRSYPSLTFFNEQIIQANRITDDGAALARRDAFLASNTSAKAVLSNGLYDYTNGFTVYFDHILSAEELAAGSVWIDIYDPDGGTWTVSERDSSSEIVAAVSIPTVGTRRQLKTATLNGSTDRLRISGTRANGTSGSFSPPAVVIGTPATVPTDSDYLAALFEQMTLDDGVDIATLSHVGQVTGTAPTKIDDRSFSAVSGSVGSWGYYKLTKPVPTDGYVTVLIEIESDNLAPFSLNLTPVDGKGTAASSITVRRRFTGSARFLATIPAIAGTLPLAYIRLDVRTTTGGTNAGPAEAVTLSLWAFEGEHLPKLRAVPAIVGQAIETVQEETLASARSAAAALDVDASTDIIIGNALRRMVDSRIAMRDNTQYFISPDGDDGDDGTFLEPKKSLKGAVTAAATGRAVALEAGKSTFVDSGPGSGTLEVIYVQNKNLTAYGGAERRTRKKAVLDSRYNLSGHTWTNVSGDLWHTQVTFENPTTQNGVAGADSTNFALWYATDPMDPIGSRLTWKTNDTDASTNQANCAATALSWAINKDGSTAADVRTAGAATVHDVYVNLGSGVDPNGKRLMIDSTKMVEVVGGHHTDLLVIGCARKDHFHTAVGADGRFPLIERFEQYGFPAHGHVGPFDLDGFYKAIGRGVEGNAKSMELGRSVGGAANMFTGIDHSTRIITLNGKMYVGCASSGSYGHTSGTLGYKCIDARALELFAFNCGVGIKFDGNTAPGAFTQEESIFGRVEIAPWTDPATGISYQGCDTGFDIPIGGQYTFLSGKVVSSVAPGSNSAVGFCNMSGQNTAHFKNMTFEAIFERTGDLAQTGTTLAGNMSQISTDVPTVMFENFADLTKIDRATGKLKAYLPRFTVGGHSTSDLIIYLLGQGEIGSLHDQAAGTNFPKGLFVEAGWTFGMGDRTGPEIEAALTGAGLVDGVDFDISGMTTIVGRFGEILSLPGWK